MFGRSAGDDATIVRLLAAQVRRDIAIGRLVPDQRLKIEDLRQSYGGSAHSFREALTLLSNEGMVEANAQRGFRVASATPADLEDIIRLRAEIEPMGLGWSMDHADPNWEATLLAASHVYARHCRLVSDALIDGAVEWNEAGRALHTALVSNCRSPRLIDFQRRLYQQSSRFRFAALAQGELDLLADADELRRIVEAATAGRRDEAVSGLASYLRSMTKTP